MEIEVQNSPPPDDASRGKPDRLVYPWDKLTKADDNFFIPYVPMPKDKDVSALEWRLRCSFSKYKIKHDVQWRIVWKRYTGKDAGVRVWRRG